MPDSNLSSTWNALEAEQERLSNTHLRALFADNSERQSQFNCQAGSWLLDYSRQRVDQLAMHRLQDLASAAELDTWRHALFAGEPVNQSENRAAGHWALRRPSHQAAIINGKNIAAEVATELNNMRRFTEQLEQQSWRGHSNQAIKHIVSIGIGGSDLGPRMAADALQHYRHNELKLHFVANADPADLYRVLADLEPAETLFIVISKTFTTAETINNAITARHWLSTHLGEDCVSKHMVAVSAAEQAVADFGIDTDQGFFRLWDWVGGRYSLCSAVGLPLMLSIGSKAFTEFLAGCHQLDEYFRTTPDSENLVTIFALLGIWNRNLLNLPNLAIAPYSQRLKLLPAHLQQLEMESNGKSTSRDGHKLEHATNPALWGTAGTMGQHSYFQLLHQGTDIIPVDFIAHCQPALAEADKYYLQQHDRLMANMLAQSEALAFGQSETGSNAPAKHEFSGNRPHNILLTQRLTPHSLGELIALYEHKVFVQAVIWEINPFDQWGVELGKRLAKNILPQINQTPPDASKLQPGTAALIQQYQRWR